MARFNLHTARRGTLHADTWQEVANIARPGDVSEDTTSCVYPFTAWTDDSAGMVGIPCETWREACAIGPRNADLRADWTGRSEP